VAHKILLCVTGGIAAYKTPELVRVLVRAGHEVQVLVSTSGLAFVSELALATVSGRPVRHSLLDASEEGRVGHIELADWPDLVLVAPATAHVMACAAHGMAGDLITTVLLATRAPVLFAPAMNTNMWRHAATQANFALLAARGGAFVGPDAGLLACGWEGEGRMSDPSVIAEAVALRLDPAPSHASGGATYWTGRRVLVSAGPTRTYLDPVRFLTNASSGAMGFALAEAAAEQGAHVVLVAGPVERATPAGVQRVDVETAEQMCRAMEIELEGGAVDCVAMVAAVSDFAAAPSPEKAPKDELLSRLRNGALIEGIDVLARLTERFAHRTFFLGFGAQTLGDAEAEPDSGALIALGEKKLASKGCHALFVNRVGIPGRGFGATSENAGVLLFATTPERSCESYDVGAPMPKPQLARWLLARLAARGLAVA